MDPKFTYDDTVVIDEGAEKEFRPGEKASIIGVFPDRDLDPYPWLPPGTVYTVEFENGDALDVPEAILRLFPEMSPGPR